MDALNKCVNECALLRYIWRVLLRYVALGVWCSAFSLYLCRSSVSLCYVAHSLAGFAAVAFWSVAYITPQSLGG